MFERIKNGIRQIRFNKSRSLSRLPNYLTFTPREVAQLNKPLEQSIFFTSALTELTQTIAESWDPYFADSNGNEIDRPDLMALIDNPFSNYDRSDLMEQFSKQLILYSVAVIKLIDGAQGFEQQVLSGKTIEKIDVKDGFLSNARVNTINGHLDINLLDKNSEHFGVVSLQQSAVDGWDQTEITPKPIELKLQTTIDAEIMTREAVTFDSLQIRNPRTAFIFPAKTPTEYMDNFEQRLTEGAVPQHIVAKDATIQNLSQGVTGDVLNNRLISLRRSMLISMGIPPEVFELPASVSRTLYRAVLKNFYKRAVDPYISAYNNVWNTQIGDLYPNVGNAELKNHDTLPDDIDTKIARIRNLVDGDIITINEGREDIDKQPLAGGDTLRFGEPSADRVEELANINVPTPQEDEQTRS